MIINGKYKLEPISLGDLEFARVLRNSSFVNKYLSNTDYKSEERQLRWYLDKYVPANEQQRFIVMRKQEKIGFVSLIDIRLENRKPSAYAGIFISQEHWGSRASDAALQLLREYVFRGLCLETVVAHIIKENKSAMNLAKRIGCVEISAEEFAEYCSLPIDGSHAYFKYLRSSWKEDPSIKINANHALSNLATFPKPVPDASQTQPNPSA